MIPPHASKAAETRRRIERAALTLFVEKGVAETTTRDIAARAGISEGAIYRHFPSKDALAYGLFAEHYKAFAQTLAAVASQKDGALEKLGAMIRCFCALFDEDPDLFSYLLLAQHQEIRKLPDDTPSPVDVIAQIIANGVRDKEILQPTPDSQSGSEFASAMFLGIVLQTATARLYGRLTCPLSDLADSLAESARRLLSASH